MIPCKLQTSKQTFRFQVPSHPSEITYSMGCLCIEHSDDNAKVYSILTGLGEDLIRDNLEVYAYIESKISPDILEIKNKDVAESLLFQYQDEYHEINQDISELSIGQYEDMKAVIAGCKDEKDLIPLMGKVASIYLSDMLLDGDYDYEKAEQLAEELQEYPFVDVVSLGYFFFIKLNELKSDTTNVWLWIAIQVRKLKQDIRNYLSLTGSILR